MEITAVDTYTLRVPIGRDVGDSGLTISDVYWIVVDLSTDEGYTGTGWMGSLGFGPDILQHFLNHYTTYLVGLDPFSTEAIRNDLRRGSIYFGELGISA